MSTRMARHEQLERLLRDLSEQPGVQGAALISRDGLLIRSVGKQDGNRETFSAMSATMMGAAEIALAEIDSSPLRFMLAQTDTKKIVTMGATPDMLLVVHADASLSLDAILGIARSAAGEVAAVIAG